jgi:anti-sigma regulatory factor (Ser/Thr protein kinase)
MHGRGMQLIRGLMDDVSIVSDQEGTVVHMEKRRAT